ncbi:MAG: DUF5677 domain-containing protein [Gaiellaceae bacterium]
MATDPQEPPHGDQEGRNAKARREIARAAGVAMIVSTASLEEEAFVERGVDPMGLVLLAFAARGRRLLRAAYRLIDNGERAEAAPLLRVLHEYLIVARWLDTDPVKHLPMWAKDDLRQRGTTLERILSDEDLDEEVKQIVRGKEDVQQEKLRAFLARLPEEEEQAPKDDDRCPTCGHSRKKRKGLPPLEVMSGKVGLGFAYNVAYRLQSQGDVHATMLVIDNTLIQQEDGQIMIRPEPDSGLSGYDPYQLGAHLLLDLLRPVDGRWPDLGWGPVLDAAAASLEALRKLSRPDAQA